MELVIEVHPQVLFEVKAKISKNKIETECTKDKSI
jgi:hypothetical protein